METVEKRNTDVHNERTTLVQQIESLLSAHPEAAPIIESLLDHLEHLELSETTFAEVNEFFRFCREHPFLALFMTSLAHVPLDTDEIELARG